MNNTNRSDDNNEIIGDIVDAIGVIAVSCVNSVNNGVVTNVDSKRNTNNLSPQMVGISAVGRNTRFIVTISVTPFIPTDQGFGIEFEMSSLSDRSLNPAKSATSGSYSMGLMVI